MNNYWVLFMANMNIARRNAGYNYMYIIIYILNNIIGIHRDQNIYWWW